MQLGDVPLDLERAAVAADRFGGPIHALVNTAQVAVKGGRAGIQLDSAADLIDRQLAIAALGIDHAQQIPGGSVIRLDGENLPADLLGGLQAASPLVIDGSSQALRKRFPCVARRMSSAAATACDKPSPSGRGQGEGAFEPVVRLPLYLPQGVLFIRPNRDRRCPGGRGCARIRYARSTRNARGGSPAAWISHIWV